MSTARAKMVRMTTIELTRFRVAPADADFAADRTAGA
jgi:hypothetical protein